MSQKITLALRVLQAILAVTNLGLASYVAHWYVSGSRKVSPSSLNFLIFAPLFSLLSIAYLELAPRRLPRATHPFASLTVEFLNTLFYFSGFIAFAVYLGQLAFCIGTVCGAGRAVVVIASFEFTTWIVTTILLAKDLFKGGFRPPTKATAMPMQQV